MIPFFRRNKKSGPAPEWTSFSNLSDYEDFIQLVKRYFDRKKITYTIEEDGIIAEHPDWPDQMGLSNMAQMCEQSPRSSWKGIINAQFDGMLRNRGFEKVFYEKAHEYSYAAPYIGVRIYSKLWILVSSKLCNLLFSFYRGCTKKDPVPSVKTFIGNVMAS